MNTVNCIKYGNQQIGLSYVPYPGELGEKIHQNISDKFWQEWLAHQVMFINENRLSPIKSKDREKIMSEMKAFLFDGNAKPIEGFIPE